MCTIECILANQKFINLLKAIIKWNKYLTILAKFIFISNIFLLLYLIQN